MSIESVLHPPFTLSHLTINTASQTTATVLISQTLQFRNMAYLPQFTILEWGREEIQPEVSLALRPALESLCSLWDQRGKESRHTQTACVPAGYGEIRITGRQTKLLESPEDAGCYKHPGRRPGV